MDFNDFDMRIKRVHAALGARYESDIITNTKSEIIESEGKRKLNVIFGTNSQEASINVVMSAISAIAHLKDHLRQKLHGQNKDPELIEDTINNSPSLCLILDLSNKDKHGDPLLRTNRSGKNPRLADIQQGLSPINPGKSSFTISFDGKNVTPSIREGSFRIVTSGRVVDGSGVAITTLDEMLTNGMSDIENFISVNNLDEAN